MLEKRRQSFSDKLQTISEESIIIWSHPWQTPVIYLWLSEGSGVESQGAIRESKLISLLSIEITWQTVVFKEVNFKSIDSRR